jgi:hypothetical protein
MFGRCKADGSGDSLIRDFEILCWWDWSEDEMGLIEMDAELGKRKRRMKIEWKNVK